MYFDPAGLEADFQRYVALGPHRSGLDGDRASADWMAGELTRAGYAVERQMVPFRQWVHEAAWLEIDGERLEGFPLWWPPTAEDARRAAATMVDGAQASQGDIAVITVPTQLQGGLRPGTRQAITDAIATGVAGIVLVTETPSGEPYAFNAPAQPDAWPVPILIVGSAHTNAIERAMSDGGTAELQLVGHYIETETENTIARLARGGERTVVVSTPRNGWFLSGGERGPGVALFLATAEWALATGDADLVFVATGGHEVGHIGMSAFLAERAPPPADTALWVHFGSSIAVKDRSRLEDDPPLYTDNRWIIFTPGQVPKVQASFADLGYTPVLSTFDAFGEAKDIRDAGYPEFFAFAGWHPFFHQPEDDATSSSGELIRVPGEAVTELIAPDL